MGEYCQSILLAKIGQYCQPMLLTHRWTNTVNIYCFPEDRRMPHTYILLVKMGEYCRLSIDGRILSAYFAWLIQNHVL